VYHLFGDDSQHSSVRATLVEFEQWNELLFRRFLISPINKSSFEEHVMLLKSPNSWAAQVEVIAVASLNQLPVYYCKYTADNNCH